jgi:DNA processing protein
MSESELIALLRLVRVPGVGPVTARKLIAHFGGAQAVFDEAGSGSPKAAGIRKEALGNLLDPAIHREALEQWDRIRKQGIRCLAYWDGDYPGALRHCEDAPALLFFKGSVALSGRRFISIVGTRNMTAYGREFCESFLEGIARYRPVIVSGLAYGIDLCAQLAALNLGLETIACLGHGLDRMYPEPHAKYASRILEQGGLLSEFWLGTRPEPMNFVRRNRIIAGLSEATVVVESADRGGSLVTADLAFGYHREVFAVPGRVGDYFSRGCNELIRQQKAQILHGPGDFALAMNWSAPEGAPPPEKERQISMEGFSEEERRVVSLLAREGEQFLDAMAQQCQLPVGHLAALLLRLELKGVVEPLPAKKFRIKPA